jgi:hypothetical protein
MHSPAYVIPETPDFLLAESALSAELRARATVAMARRAKVRDDVDGMAASMAEQALEPAPDFDRHVYVPLPSQEMEALYCADMDEAERDDWELGRQWKPDRHNRRNAQRDQARSQKLAHLDFLHPRGRTAADVILLDKDCRSPKPMHPAAFRRRTQAIDEACFVSLNTFEERRIGSALASIRAVWADAELRKGSPFEAMDRRVVAEILLARLQSEGIPFPSYILDSGRGLWPVWVFEGMCPSARKRVKAVINYLNGPRVHADGTAIHSRHARHSDRVRACEERAARVWAGFALDHAVRDVTRVHRLAGSVNPKSGTVVRLVWPASFGEAERVDFEALAAAVLPYGRDEVKAYHETKAAGTKPAAAAKPRPRMSRWGAIAADLLALARHLGHSGLEGRRDLVAYHVATAWSHMGQGGTAAFWAARLAPVVGLPEDELARYLSGVAHRLRRHEAGETTTWDGRTVPVLYSPSNAKVIEDLGLTPELADAAGMTYLRPGNDAEQAVAAKDRKAAQRRREGRVTREEQADTRALLARLAREMLADGIPLTEIAALADCARGTVYGALAANPAPVVEAVAIATEEASDTPSCVQDVSRHLMVPPSAPVSTRAAAPEAAQTTTPGDGASRRVRPVPAAVAAPALHAPSEAPTPDWDLAERTLALTAHFEQAARSRCAYVQHILCLGGTSAVEMRGVLDQAREDAVAMAQQEWVAGRRLVERIPDRLSDKEMAKRIRRPAPRPRRPMPQPRKPSTFWLPQ